MRTGTSYSEAGKLGWEKSKEKINARFKKLKESYDMSPKHCRFCNSIIPYDKRERFFCGHSCSASFNNKGIRRHGETATRCMKCGRETKNSRRKYCSMTCNYQHKWEEAKAKIERSLVFPPSPRVSKRYLKETQGIKCKICGISAWRGKEVPLVLDHINGNPDDWTVSNLRLICGNCDMQTGTYKGKNIGNGRHYRRMRYKNGKSY